MPSSWHSPPNRRQPNACPSSWISLMNTNMPHSKSRLSVLPLTSTACLAASVRLWRRVLVGRPDHRAGGEDDGQPDERAELAEHQPDQRHPADEEPVRVPQRDPGEQHVHQPVLELLLGLRLVPAEQDGGVGRDVGVDQVRTVQVRQDLDDLGLGRGVVGDLPAAQVPGLLDASGCRRAARRTGTPGRRGGGTGCRPGRGRRTTARRGSTAARSGPPGGASPSGSSPGTRTRRTWGGVAESRERPECLGTVIRPCRSPVRSDGQRRTRRT